MADGAPQLQQFNLPTNVGQPVRPATNLNLQFPVFTPPAASSYGSTQPMAVPWKPPDLAGALNAGLRTGAEIGATFMNNRQKAQQLAAQRQAQQYAQTAMAQPGAAERMGVTMGPEGFTTTLLSPAELEMKRIQMLEAQTRAEEARAREAEIYGETPKAQAEKKKTEAETAKAEAETRKMGTDAFGYQTQGTAEGAGGSQKEGSSGSSVDESGKINYRDEDDQNPSSASSASANAGSASASANVAGDTGAQANTARVASTDTGSDNMAGLASTEPSDQGAAISDAEATDINQMPAVQEKTTAPKLAGVKPPQPPSLPSASTVGGAGQATSPDQQQQALIAQGLKKTLVPSKGGLPTQEMSASAEPGAVPEGLKTMASPPVKGGAGTRTAPEERAAPTPPPISQPAQPKPAAQQSPLATLKNPDDETQPRVINPDLEKVAARERIGPQDYSNLPPSVTSDPNFAGLANGHPFFFDPEKGTVYVRQTVGVGDERRFYRGDWQNQKEGVLVHDETKAAATREAQGRITALVQAREAIDDFIAQRGRLDDLDANQKMILAGMRMTGANPVEVGEKGLANWINQALGNKVSPEQLRLDMKRQAAANAAAMAINRTLPEKQAMATALDLPGVGDTKDQQLDKARNLKTILDREAQALSVQYPYMPHKLQQALLGKIRLTAVDTGAGGQNQPAGQSAPAASTAQPSPTPSATPSAETVSIQNQDDYNKLPNGQRFRYNGREYVKDVNAKKKAAAPGL